MNSCLKTTITAIALFVPLACQAQAVSEYRVLPAEFNADKANQMMRAYQRKQVHAALDARLEEFEAALESPAAVEAYQRKRRAYLGSVFGPLPQRSPLNAQVTRRVQRDGYSIEHVLFESLPGFHVTANLYRPPGDGPFPGVLLPCGHSANGKAYSSYQKASILLARHGFVVLCFDPLGQGERRQLIGDTPHKISRPRSEHNPLGVAPILLGRSLAAMMVWDGMRAMDYLCSRSEVDPTRIGCTGNSGGGNLTSYLMAFDERIVAAAPGCFITTHRRKNEFPGPGDAEQNLHAQIREGFDHPDFVLARAPKPTLILAATHDYVPIDGAWDAFRQAKRAYTVLGYPERIELLETNNKHGFSKRMREGAVRFMARWLQERHVEVFEDEDVPILSDEQLQVTPHGQVRWLPGAKSVFDVYAESEQALAARRPPLNAKLVRQTTGIRPLAKLPEPQVEIIRSEESKASTETTVGETAADASASPRKLVFRPEPGIVLPALHWPGGERQPIVIAPSDGIASAVEQARRLHAEGHPVLIVEVRDSGETRTINWRFPGADSFIGQMLGRSWLAMRAEDLLVTARWLAESSAGKQAALHAVGETAPAALHAGYLEPDLIAGVQTTNGLTSWRELMTSRDAYTHIHQAVFGALRSYDLPDLRRQGAKTQARLERPNILLILCDDLGYSDLGCYGGEIQTSHLDQLAADGMRFTQFYNCAVCVTTRSALLTGLYPRQAKRPRLRTDMVTLGEVMRRAGYATSLTGKWHLGSQAPLRPIDRGFDEYYGVLDGCCNFFNPAKQDPVFYNGGRFRAFAHNDQRITEFPPGYYTTDAFSDHAVETIQRFAKGPAPFFVHLCYTAPHFPLHAFAEDIQRYRGKYSDGYLAMRERRHARQAELGLFASLPQLSAAENKKGDYRYDYDVPNWGKLAAAERQREEARMETYAAMVERMDRGIGRVLAALDDAGVADNTVVMFLSDNGGCASWPSGKVGQEEAFIEYNQDIPVGDGRGYEFVGKGWGWAQNAPFRQFKTWCYEGGIATPMIVRWPGNVERGSITHQVGHIIDFMPTLLELAGSDYPFEFDGKKLLALEGKSLLPVLRGQRRGGHESLSWELFGNRAIRQGDWKLVWGASEKRWELYDLEADRSETNNLAPVFPDRVAAMASDWEAWRERVEK